MNIGEFELKASCKAYCDLKQKIGAPNLKVQFLTAYEQGDLDFFAEVVMAFANPKPKNKQAVFDEFDKFMEQGIYMEDIYTELVNFAYGMGFFGRVDLKGQDIQEFMREPLNKLDMSAAMTDAITSAAMDVAKSVVR